MNLQGPELVDIHLPPEPLWWPPAPGWWLLGLLVIALLVMLIYWIRQLWQRRQMLALFERELDAIQNRHPHPAQSAARVAEVSVLLRRLARLRAPQTMTLIDEDWLRFLDGTDPARPFSEGFGRMLLDAPYRPSVPAEDADALIDLVRRGLPQWLERHDV